MKMLKSELYFPIIVGFHLVLWLVDLSLYDGPLILSEGEDPLQRVVGEVMSSWVVTVFGFNLLMATRARWVERVFGGLDKMYLIQRRSGVIAVVLLLLHFAIVPRFPEFSIGKPMGFAALILIFVGVMISVAPYFKRRLSYNRWLSAHRFMGIAYVVGVCHALFVPSLIADLTFIRAYVIGMALVGILSWLYRILIHDKVRPSIPYTIASIRTLDSLLTELILKPQNPNQKLSHHAGQFAFFTIPSLEPRESHPFTIASAPSDGTLRVVIKALGDYTASLPDKVEVGQVVEVEGPYGHFTQDRTGEKKQLWVAGGIGVTPFLAMAQALSHEGEPVSLYWSVRSRDEAHFDDELRALADGNPRLTYTLWLSGQSGYLSLDKLPESQWDATSFNVLSCGPAALTGGMETAMKIRRAPRWSVHSEEFTFR